MQTGDINYFESKLLEKVVTTEDRDLMLSEIELLQKSLFKGEDRSYEHILKTEVRAWAAQIIESESKAMEIRPYLEGLEKSLNKIEEIKLGLAFEPSESSLERIHDKIIKLVGKSILIDLTVNRAIVGGAVIIFRGKYRDFSMKKLFELEMLDIRDDILKIMDKYSQEKNKTE